MKYQRFSTFALVISAGLALGLTASGALAGPGHGNDQGQGSSNDIGMPGKKAEVTRTINVTMTDLAYDHQAIVVVPGETVRFLIVNKGELLHEFNIGAPDSHAKHQREMMQMMEMGMLTPTGIDAAKIKMDHSAMGMGPMKHDDPNSVLLAPGKTQELIWKFSKSAKLEFACNVPGHYQSGMVGKFDFVRKATSLR
jgi:uncharacterized cupredoxin-like copper-binding protein